MGEWPACGVQPRQLPSSWIWSLTIPEKGSKCHSLPGILNFTLDLDQWRPWLPALWQHWVSLAKQSWADIRYSCECRTDVHGLSLSFHSKIPQIWPLFPTSGDAFQWRQLFGRFWPLVAFWPSQVGRAEQFLPGSILCWKVHHLHVSTCKRRLSSKVLSVLKSSWQVFCYASRCPWYSENDWTCGMRCKAEGVLPNKSCNSPVFKVGSECRSSGVKFALLGRKWWLNFMPAGMSSYFKSQIPTSLTTSWRRHWLSKESLVLYHQPGKALMFLK